MFKNKEGKVYSGWKIIGMMAVTLSALTVASILIGIIAGIIISPRLAESGTIDTNALFTESEKYLLDIISYFLQETVMIVIPIIIWKFFIKRPLTNMGLAPISKHAKELAIGLAFGVVSITVVFAALILSGSAKVETWKPNFSWDQLIFLVVFILVGLAEEIFTRGYIMSVLRQSRNLPLVIIVSSVIFALMHSMNSGIGAIPYLNLALVGILFAVMYIRSGNLWMCIGYHITWNYFQGYVYGFKVSGNESNGILTTVAEKYSFLNGGDFGPEGGIFVTIVILLGLLFVMKFYKKSEFDFIASEDLPKNQPIPEENINPYNPQM